jgi:AAA+ ATPase superfamily predicted ATPase
MNQPAKFARASPTLSLEEVVSSSHAEFVYVRGRRRIGKSWLLKKLSTSKKNIFYYMGSLDNTNSHSMKEFIQEWCKFSSTTTLLQTKNVFLNWKLIFQEITTYAKKSKIPTTLIFDEIQWMAKEGSGFVGNLKEAWIDWEQSNNVKVIICGSSNKFFIDKVGGEEKILRGMKTRSDIIIRPITLKDCYQQRFHKWKKSEMVLAYMLTGGVPYYLNQFDSSKSFMTAVNDAFFTENTIYLSEIEEVLSLEFNKQGIKTVSKILEAIGINGCGENNILKKYKIPKSTLSTTLSKLERYNVLKQTISLDQKLKSNNSGVKYKINDFYLNTYFQIIKPLAKKIKQNKKEILFKYSSNKLYIENYTGPMFEKIIEELFANGTPADSLFRKLDLRSPLFDIETYWDKEQQIDLIINSHEDRRSLAFEIKWQILTYNETTSLLRTLAEKTYPISPYYTRENYVVCIDTEKKLKPPFVVTIDDLF